MTDLRKQLVPRHIGSTFSEFMLEMCPLCTDTSMQTTAPLADSSINDRLVKLCSLAYQTCFEFLEVMQLSWSDKHSPVAHSDAVVYRVKVRRIRWPQCWRNEVRGVSRSRKATVSRARCAGALCCWNIKNSSWANWHMSGSSF